MSDKEEDLDGLKHRQLIRFNSRPGLTIPDEVIVLLNLKEIWFSCSDYLALDFFLILSNRGVLVVS